MSKLEYPKCPYCGKKVNIWTAGYVARKQEYKCDSCEKKSFVKIKYSVFLLIRLFIVITTLIAFFAVLFNAKNSLWFYLVIIVNSACIALMPCFAELVKNNECNLVDTEKKLKDK